METVFDNMKGHFCDLNTSFLELIPSLFVLIDAAMKVDREHIYGKCDKFQELTPP